MTIINLNHIKSISIKENNKKLITVEIYYIDNTSYTEYFKSKLELDQFISKLPENFVKIIK